MPYGAKLPALNAYKPQPSFFEKLQSEGFYVSGATYGPVLEITASTVTIAIRDDVGQLTYILTSVLTSDRLLAAMKSLQLPAQMRTAVVDHDNILIAGSKEFLEALHLPTPGTTSGINPGPPGHQVWHVRTPSDVGYYVTSAQASLANWTTYVALPDTVFQKAEQQTWGLLLAAMALLGLVGGLLYRVLHRRLEAPIETMGNMVREAEDAIALLTKDIRALRTTEHKRIAQELHDTTAQHLVAADLFLNAMKRSGTQSQAPLIAELEVLIKTALQELRSFSFLLRPLANCDEALTENLTALYRGYSSRAGVRCEVTIDRAADSLPPELREALFKVAREALTNVHRHAQAQSIWFSLTIEDGNGSVMTIKDDGRGGAIMPNPERPVHGLGLQGIQDYATTFGGSFSLDSGPGGTTVTFRVPADQLARHQNSRDRGATKDQSDDCGSRNEPDQLDYAAEASS